MHYAEETRLDAGRPRTRVFLERDGPERETAERALIERGVAIPALLTMRASLVTEGDSALVVVEDEEEGELRPVWGFGFRVHHTRSIPGFSLWRVPRLRADSLPLLEAGLRALIELADERRVLAIAAEPYGTDQTELNSLEAVLQSLGFRGEHRGWTYTCTAFVDLRPSEHDILYSFHSTGRRHIRVVGKKPVAVEPVHDRRYAGRMAELHRESMERTGGDYQEEDWPAWMELAEDAPELCAIRGMVDEEREGPDRLLGFAIALKHGDIAEYSFAASTRDIESNIPLLYAPAWELIRWAKAAGATWFDFGGVTAGTHETEDPLGGISDFKRYFSGDVRRVSAEYTYEVSPLLHSLSSFLRSGLGVVRNALPGTAG